MKAVSAKTAARDRRYAIDRVEFLEANPICGALLEGCRWISTEVHHKAGRLPSVFFRQDLWLAVCWSCHHRITTEPAMAFERGLSVHRNQVREVA